MTEEDHARLDRIEGQIAAVVVAIRLLVLEQPQNDGLIDSLHQQIDSLQLELPGVRAKAAQDWRVSGQVVTISIGACASLPLPDSDSAALSALADTEPYRSKQIGRRRACGAALCHPGPSVAVCLNAS